MRFPSPLPKSRGVVDRRIAQDGIFQIEFFRPGHDAHEKACDHAWAIHRRDAGRSEALALRGRLFVFAGIVLGHILEHGFSGMLANKSVSTSGFPPRFDCSKT